jgi:adenosylcobinamide-phosphate synthase
VGGQTLTEHPVAVQKPLLAGQLEQARLAIARMVSRDTHALDAGQIAAATAESVLENGCDAVFGALFWFLVAGLPGVAIYRLTNTLDAMWGYRNARYRYFGWAAARLDDVLNFIPARLTALAYALCGHTSTALRAWRVQGGRWKSPNAGPVMAAGAGALQIELGGAASYHGESTQRPSLGFGRQAEINDIARAIKLVQRALLLWLTLGLIGGILLA